MTNPDDQVPTPPPEPARELQARAAQGAVWTVLQTFISLGIGFLVNLVVARYLGVADFGRLATISLAVEALGHNLQPWGRQLAGPDGKQGPRRRTQG